MPSGNLWSAQGHKPTLRQLPGSRHTVTEVVRVGLKRSFPNAGGKTGLSLVYRDHAFKPMCAACQTDPDRG